MTQSGEARFQSLAGRGIKPSLNIVTLLLILPFIVTSISACDRDSNQAAAVQAGVEETMQEAAEAAQTETVAEPEAEEAEEAAEEVIKVVYHADFADPRRFSAMLTSINNMVTTYQNDLIEYDVRIVFIAHGIRFLTDDKLAKTPFSEDKAMKERRESNKGRLLSLQEVQGVKLELCNITRTGIGLPEEAVFDVVELTPSGVVRIAELQREGFSYLKIE